MAYRFEANRELKAFFMDKGLRDPLSLPFSHAAGDRIIQENQHILSAARQIFPILGPGQRLYHVSVKTGELMLLSLLTKSQMRTTRSTPPVARNYRQGTGNR